MDASFSSYQNPALATDLVVFGYDREKLSVLLLNRKDEPFKNQWTLPGAFLRMEETFQQACTRVLQTKLGLEQLYLEQLYTFDAPERDPRGRVISVASYALVNPARLVLAAGTMANDVQWCNIKTLPTLGFDHTRIFQIALQRLRSKIQYFPVGFELLDELFTMGELHALYQHILDTEIDRRNFSRKILDATFIINTGARREGVRNRNPELYCFNKQLAHQNFHLNINIL